MKNLLILVGLMIGVFSFGQQKLTGIRSLKMPAWGYQIFVKKNGMK
jgi:hypothetical protein